MRQGLKHYSQSHRVDVLAGVVARLSPVFLACTARIHASEIFHCRSSCACLLRGRRLGRRRISVVVAPLAVAARRRLWQPGTGSRKNLLSLHAVAVAAPALRRRGVSNRSCHIHAVARWSLLLRVYHWYAVRSGGRLLLPGSKLGRQHFAAAARLACVRSSSAGTRLLL